MYLSIGSDLAVRDSSIIGIFDLDNTTVSKRTRVLLSAMQKAGRVHDACEAGTIPKSMILTEYAGERGLWLSQYSPQTLARRMEGTVAPSVYRAYDHKERQIRVETTQKDR